MKDTLNALLIQSGLADEMWGEAVLTANYLQNKLPHKQLDKTPYELWKGRKPSYQYLKGWGCLAKVVIPLPKRTKIGPKTVDCIFIGYAAHSSAYRFMVHKSEHPDIEVDTIMESRNATFFENIFPLKVESSERRKFPWDPIPNQNDLQIDPQRNKRPLPVDSINDIVQIEQTDDVRRSRRSKKAKTFGPDFVTTFMVENDPQTFKEAMSTPEAPQWKEAINSEIESIMQNHTWELVDLPKGSKPLGCKWIFKRKLKPDGSIDKYKARLVAKGFNQREGVDYFDTYAPVTRITSIRLLIAFAALRGLTIHQMDVKTAFLNGELEEEIYMRQPEGFIAKGNESKVCRLVKSLYGLKQAPKQWHKRFDDVMIANGFRINECDKCVYGKNTPNGYVIICLYVDDMLILGSNDKMVTETKNILTQRFDMKDLGLADVILGIKISRTPEGITLSQSHYVEQLLEKFNKGDNNVAKTPVDLTLHLIKNTSHPVDQLQYSRIIGSLMYLTNCTRPDLAQCVNRLSRYTSNPSAHHWKAMTRVLRYLRYTKTYGLHYGKYPAVIEGYSDANWISDTNDSKSTSGFVFTLGGGAIAWKSSKQTCIARSTMESEFIALDKTAEEAEWLRNFLEDIPSWEKPVPAICIHCDSQAAIGRAQSNMYNGKSRHIRRRHNTVRQLLSNGIITIDYIRSKDNLADPFTKGLPKELVCSSSRGMGLKPMH